MTARQLAAFAVVAWAVGVIASVIDRAHAGGWAGMGCGTAAGLVTGYVAARWKASGDA